MFPLLLKPVTTAEAFNLGMNESFPLPHWRQEPDDSGCEKVFFVQCEFDNGKMTPFWQRKCFAPLRCDALTGVEVPDVGVEAVRHPSLFNQRTNIVQLVFSLKESLK